MSKNNIRPTKLRIFVDGSYDNDYKIGTIAYHIQDYVEYDGKIVKLNIHNKVFAEKLYRCTGSLDTEICAIAKGLDTFKKMVGCHPIMQTVPVRIKSDSMPAIKYITKGKWTDGFELDKDMLDDLELIRNNYEWLRKRYPNLKLSYVPSKQNLAHNNAYEMLRWERSSYLEGSAHYE